MIMDKQYPQRINTHQLEEISERYFRGNLPRNWTCEKPSKDYGVDLRVDLFDGNNATGLELLVQLKSSLEGNDKEYETMTLDVTTYNHLWDKLQVVILVKYVENENAAYWIYLREVPEPNQEHQSFTVRIPKTNLLDKMNWGAIYQNIREVTDEKLAAARRRKIQEKFL